MNSMKKHMILVSVLAIGAVGCAPDNKNLEKKLDDMNKTLIAMQGSINDIKAAGGRAGAAAPGQQPGQRPKRVEPGPKDVFAVPIAGDAIDGPADALITIVKGYEYACPYCEKVRPTFAQLKKDYPAKIRIVSKHFVVHPQVATTPALAACASNEQGKFFDRDGKAGMDTLLWDKAFAVRKFDDANMEALATEAGLNLTKFKTDMKGFCTQKIQQDQAELQVFGMGATPTFFINGRYMSGAQPLPSFKAIIDEELKLAEKRVKEGTAPADYYKTWILDKGMKKFTPPKEPAEAPKQPQPQPKAPAQPQPGTPPANKGSAAAPH
jgi:protein-disulfide isomerase